MNAERKWSATESNIARKNQEAQPRAASKLENAFSQAIQSRHSFFGLFILFSLAVFWPSLKALVHAALHFDFCSQILVVPFITIFLVYARRRTIFRRVEGGYITGGLIFLTGWIVYWLARHDAAQLGSYDSLSVSTLGMVLIWAAGFYALYGPIAFRAAEFPLGFLLLTVPIPSYVLNRAVFYLQSGSTAIAHGLFELLGVPVIRHGFLLSLPGLTIEVAKECSSIRSSIALLITCLLAGYLFLHAPWKRTALVLFALPLSVFKNGVRIVTLSVLSIYVDPAFMTSDLHRDGGILFYLLALAILYPLFRWFEKSDRRSVAGQAALQHERS